MSSDDKYAVFRRDPDGDGWSMSEGVDIPYFVLLAKDVFAVDVVRYYEGLMQTFHPDPEYVRQIRAILRTFEDWRLEHQDQVKVPD